ncbi:MAG TPA: hypothetical protein VH540_13525 [Ktedonobacterales bacterium]
MMCSQCNKQLDTIDIQLGICQRCGTPITGAQAGTTFTDQALPVASAGPSHLPSFDTNDPFGNLPTMGGAVPEALPAPGGNIAPRPLSAPPETPVMAAPFQLPPPSPLPSAPPPSPRRGRKSRKKTSSLLIVGLTLLLLVVLVGAAIWLIQGLHPGLLNGSPTPTLRPTGTGASTSVPLQNYRDPAGRFSISYPAGWQPEHIETHAGSLPLALNGVQFTRGDAAFTVVAGPAPPLSPDGLAQTIDDALLRSMDARNISKPTNVRIGGQTWTEERADTDKGLMVIDSIQFNGQLYSLWYNAPPNEFPSDESSVFLPMRATFKFG